MSSKNVHAFPYFKKREGFELIFPFDNPEEKLEEQISLIGLSEENIAKAKDLNNQRALALKARIETAKAKAFEAGVLIDSMEAIAYSDAKMESLEKVLDRLAVLEERVSDQLVPWSKTQFKSALPWLLTGLTIMGALGLMGLTSRGSTPNQMPQQQQAK